MVSRFGCGRFFSGIAWGIALAVTVLAATPAADAADLTYAPGGDPSAIFGTWDATTGDWLDSSSTLVPWDQTSTAVFLSTTGTQGVYPLFNAPLQAGLRVDSTTVGPAFMYTGGATPTSLSNTQNLQYQVGLNTSTGEASPTYSLQLVGTPTINTGTADIDTVITTVISGSGGFTRTVGTGELVLRNPFSTFEGNVVVNQSGLVSTASPPQPASFGSSTAYDYYNQLNSYSGTGSLASQPQPSAMGRADIPRSVTINSGAYLMVNANNAFGGAAAPVSQITLNVNGGRVWNDFVGGLSSTYGGIDPTRPGSGQRGPVTSMGAINLVSGSMNGAWGWIGPTGTTTGTTSQLQPVASGSQAWLLRGTVTSSGSSTLNTALLSRGYSGGMHLYDTPFVVTDGTLNVPGQFFNQASSSANTPSGLSKSGAGTMVISGNNWHSGTTSVLEGTLRVEGRKSPLKVSTARVSGSTATLEINSDQTLPYLQVVQGTAKLPAAVAVTVNSSTMSVNSGSGGLLDVGGGRVNWSAGMSATTLQQRLLSGRGDGSWNGTTGITSSAANASGGTRAVGWVDNGGGSLSVAYTAPGDTNIDGYVDVQDAANFVSAGKYGTGDPATWSEGDFTYDGTVDVLDAADFISTNLYNEPYYLPPAAGATPPVVTQQFTTNPGWTSWQEVTGTVPLQSYGYQASSPIGRGGAGGGGMFVQSKSNNRFGSYYADTASFSGTNALNYSDTFFAKGTIYISNTNFNGGLGVGFFNWEQANGVTATGDVGTTGTAQGSASNSFIGIQLAEPNSPAVTGPFRSWLCWSQNNNEANQQSNSNSQNNLQVRTAASGTTLVQNTAVPFAFQFTPGLNGSGLLTGTIGGQNLSLTVATPTYYGAWTLDAFGIGTGVGGSTINPSLTAGMWVDDLIYGYGTLDSAPSLPSSVAAVPEPAVWQTIAVGLGSVGLVSWRRRRRHRG